MFNNLKMRQVYTTQKINKTLGRTSWKVSAPSQTNISVYNEGVTAGRPKILQLGPKGWETGAKSIPLTTKPRSALTEQRMLEGGHNSQNHLNG